MQIARTLVLVLGAAALAACGGADGGAHDHSAHQAAQATAPAAAPAEAPAAKPYPLTTCVVSGEELGTMGDAFVVHSDGVEVHLCCKGCVEEFEKDPAKYVGMVRAAAAK